MLKNNTSDGNGDRRRWFEFLLDDKVLIDHLASPNADPPAWRLAQEFLQDLSNPNNDATKQITIMKKKTLALRIAALDNWDLNIIMDKLPIHLQYTLLNEFCSFTRTDHPKCLGNGYEVFAYGLYCRWVMRYLFKSRVPIRGPRGLVVTTPGQNDSTFTSGEVLERIDRTVQQDAPACANWIREYIGNCRPLAKLVKECCFTCQPPYFLNDKGVKMDMSLMKGLLCYDLATYYFFNEKFQEAQHLFKLSADLLTEETAEHVKAKGYMANFDKPKNEYLDDTIEMDQPCEILDKIDKYLHQRAPVVDLKLNHESLSLERQLLICQNPDQIIKLAEKLPNGHELNSEWRMLPPHLSPVTSQSSMAHVLLAKAMELRKLEKYQDALKLLHYLSSKYPNFDQIKWELAFTHIVEGANIVPSAKKILQAARADKGVPFGMIDITVIELYNHRHFDIISGIEPRGAIIAIVRGLAHCSVTMAPGCGVNLWKTVVPFLLLKRNRNAADGCQALTFTISKIKDQLPKAIIISLFAHLYNILRDDSTSALFHEYPQFWPPNLQDANHYCLDTCAQMLQNCLYSDALLSPYWLRTLADFSFDQNYYSVALKHYIEAIIIVTNFFSEPPSAANLLDDILYRRMALCCAKLSCHTQAAILFQFMSQPDYSCAFKSLNEKNCNDSCDSLYQFIWDSNILEFLVNLHSKRGELEAKKAVIAQISNLQVNANNPKIVLDDVASLRKSAFLRTLAKQYL